MFKHLGRTVVLLGVVSFLNDLSSDMILGVLPLFIASLGGAGISVGIIGGVEDSLKSLLSVFAGHLSDRSRARKPLVMAGYAVSAVFKIMLPLAGAWCHVLALKIGERVGKGIRQAPRDAMIAEAAPRERRGLGFGFHRAMDTAGALLGSLLALGMFWLLDLDLRVIILAGGLLAFCSLVPLAAVRETARTPLKSSLRISLKGLPASYVANLSFVALFALSKFSYMFFLLRVSHAYADRLAYGVPLLMYVVHNAAYTLSSLPAGWLSDRWGRRPLLVGGYLLFALVCLGFLFADSFWMFLLLFVLYGLTHGLIEGNQRAFAADLSSQDRKGTAMGVFHMATGLAGFAGSVVAGVLWQTVAPSAAFLYGMVLSTAAAAGLLLCARPAR